MIRLLSLTALLCLLAACGGDVTHDYHPQTAEEQRENDMKSIVTKSDEPIVIYGGKSKSGGGGGEGGVAGSYLWRAALESISFMPLASSDSHGGTIITDWYSPPSTPNERFKFNILVLSSELQIGSIKVNAFRQIYVNGQWKSAEISKEIPRNIEDNILRKAISLRVKETEE